MQKGKKVFYRVLPLLTILCAGQSMASTSISPNTTTAPNVIMNPDNSNTFSADNSDDGVKNTGPFNVSVNQDSLLGVIVDTNTLLKFNSKNAAAVELAAGPRVLRANGTYGYALNDRNRIKLTGEYLTENLDFNFYSGDTRQWVNQGAVGAAYQYWLGGDKLKSFQVGSYYSHAPSKQLSDKTIVLSNDMDLLDQRRIAGGDDINGTAEASMSLWQHSLLTVGANYDQVSYDTEYEIHKDNNAQGLGGHFQLQQLLTATTELNLQSSVSSVFSTYGAGLNWVWTSNKNTAWTTGINSSYTSDHTTERHFWVNGINLNIAWGVPREGKQVAHYSDPDVAAQDLATWSAKPAVRMPDVLAISDERITNIDVPNGIVPRFTAVSAACPAPSEIEYNPNTGMYSSGNWVESYPNTPINSNVEPIFESANIMTSGAGMIECEYKVGFQKTMLLTNSAYATVEGNGNNWHNGQDPYWPSSAGQPAETCSAGVNTECVFTTADPNALLNTPTAKSATTSNNTSKWSVNKLETVNHKTYTHSV